MEMSGDIHALTRAITDSPEFAGNYLLRAEEWLRVGDLKMTQADYQSAETLALKEMEHSAWEFICQAYIDRARAGLLRCRPKSPRGLGEEALS